MSTEKFENKTEFAERQQLFVSLGNKAKQRQQELQCEKDNDKAECCRINLEVSQVKKDEQIICN